MFLKNGVWLRWIPVGVMLCALHAGAFHSPIRGEERGDVFSESPTSDENAAVPFLLPAEFQNRYFPGGDLYMIPKDKGTERLISQAKQYEKHGSAEQAARFFSLAYKRVQNTPGAPYLLFKYATLLTNIDESTEVLAQISETSPSFPLVDAARYECAKRLYIAGDLEAAWGFLSEIEEHELSSVTIFTPYVYTFMGIISMVSADSQEALSFFHRSIELLAGSGVFQDLDHMVRNYLQIAKAQLEMEAFSDAENLLLRILGSAPSGFHRQEAMLMLAHAYARRGETGRAYATYTQLQDEYSPSVFTFMAAEEKKKLSPGTEKGHYSPVIGIFDETVLTGNYPSTDEYTEGEKPNGEDKFSFSTLRSGYYIQVGSFSRRENAENLSASLAAKGFPALLFETAFEGKTLYRVRIGPIKDRNDADRIMRKLREYGYQGFLIREE
jgi:tetratricopeptide (TPR) repeat protein